MAGKYFDKTYDEIAEAVGVSVGTICRRISKYGLDSPLVFKKGRVSPNMIEYKGEILTIKEAAEKAGIKDRTLRTRLATLGHGHPLLFYTGDVRKLGSKEDRIKRAAERTGRDKSTIRRRMNEYGEMSPLMNSSGRISKTMMLFEGKLLTKADIARKLGITPQVLQYRMEKYEAGDPRIFVPGDRRCARTQYEKC